MNLEVLDDLLTCAVCLNRYSNPRLLPCQHSFCLSCIGNLFEADAARLRCPECRTEHQLRATVDEIPANRLLNNLLEALSANAESVASACEICGLSPSLGDDLQSAASSSDAAISSSPKGTSRDEERDRGVDDCAHCHKRLCSGCRAAHMRAVKLQLGRDCGAVRRCAVALYDALSTVRSVTQRLSSETESARSQVRTRSATLVEAVQRNELRLLREIDTLASREQTLLRSETEHLEAELAVYNSHCERVEHALFGTSISPAGKGDAELSEASTTKERVRKESQRSCSDLSDAELLQLVSHTAELLEQIRALAGDDRSLAAPSVALSAAGDAEQLASSHCGNVSVSHVHTPLFVQSRCEAPSGEGHNHPCSPSGSVNSPRSPLHTSHFTFAARHLTLPGYSSAFTPSFAPLGPASRPRVVAVPLSGREERPTSFASRRNVLAAARADGHGSLGLGSLALGSSSRCIRQNTLPGAHARSRPLVGSAPSGSRGTLSALRALHLHSSDSNLADDEP